MTGDDGGAGVSATGGVVSGTGDGAAGIGDAGVGSTDSLLLPQMRRQIGGLVVITDLSAAGDMVQRRRHCWIYPAPKPVPEQQGTTISEPILRTLSWRM